MRDKAAASNSYMDQTKSKYLVNTDSPIPMRRDSVVIGYEPDNIGGAIRDALVERMGFGCFGADPEFYKASEVEKIPFLDKKDTIVFNNGDTHLDWIEDQPADRINAVVANSLTETMIGTSQFVSATIDQPYKKNIVFIGSMAYRNVLNGSAPYCAAKAGLAMFARCMAWELAPKNYNVYCVHPSNTEEAPMSEKTIQGLMRYRDLSREEAEAYWSASLPREAWLQKEEIANVVCRLVSGEMNYVSGSMIELGGGQR